MKFIWATRGKSWGFRFLQTGGVANPLAVYERAFAGIDGAPALLERRDELVAVRFPDPDGRSDRAGRPIPHDFVILSAHTDSFHNVDDARAALWPEVRDEYDAIWETPIAPDSVAPE
ncbi:conserved hypothetical protein [Plantibacter sp. T3]|nr:conserved hypothetical protein [Plantibacter sp. T3]